MGSFCETRGSQREQEVARGGGLERRAALQYAGGEQAGKQVGEGENGLICNF